MNILKILKIAFKYVTHKINLCKTEKDYNFYNPG